MTDYSLETIGSSNYEFSITYPETANPTLITLDIDKMRSTIPRTDLELAALIASSINSALGTTVFQVYFDNIVISSGDVHRDNSDTICNYLIFNTVDTNFALDFSSKRSLGPLIGFGNGTYSDSFSYQGGNIPPVGAYESIHICNKAYDPSFKMFDQPTDIACKMDMYDSDDNFIPNQIDVRDATVSLPVANGYITNVREFIVLLQSEMNRYSAAFAGNPTFTVDFDPRTYLFTISNSTNARFGIGFRFGRADGSNNYGSMHQQLGFSKKNYLGYASITSVCPARILDRSYVGEYLFVCSDLIKYNYDASLIVTESNGKASHYESIFTVPVSMIDATGSYSPNFENDHRVRIHASMLAKQYNEHITVPKTTNFYLKASSGRHIKLDAQWSLKFEIEYVN